MSAEAARIERRTLQDQVLTVVLERILTGRLQPGANLSEVQLAEELGVSRTPLREALGRLEREGFIRRVPGKGFSVSPLSQEEASELYPILACLESFALELTGAPDAETCEALRRINAELAGAGGDAARALTLNERWHVTLLDVCPNGELMSLIARVWNRVRRYELAYFSPSRARVETSVGLHREILEALERGRVRAAGELLRRHWFADLDHIVPTGQTDPVRDRSSSEPGPRGRGT